MDSSPSKARSAAAPFSHSTCRSLHSRSSRSPSEARRIFHAARRSLILRRTFHNCNFRESRPQFPCVDVSDAADRIRTAVGRLRLGLCLARRFLFDPLLHVRHLRLYLGERSRAAGNTRRMGRTLTHRGPDDAGETIQNSSDICVALGHKRLSIIDLSPVGRQPMSNEDGTIWITFNGEIYNFQELRKDLKRKGHRFASRSDSEVVVHLYEEEGIACLEKLEGMFAFALWDAKRKSLLLARDRFGKKPLHYALSNTGI